MMLYSEYSSNGNATNVTVNGTENYPSQQITLGIWCSGNANFRQARKHPKWHAWNKEI